MGNRSIGLTSYVAQLEQHPEVQAAHVRLTSVEEEARAFISDTKRVISSSQQIAELEESLLSRGSISIEEQESLTRQKEEIQNEYEQLVKSAISSACSNPLTQAYATSIAAHSFNTEVIDNLPDFLPPTALASLEDVGIDPQQFKDYWNACYPKRRQAILDMCGSGRITVALKVFENSIGLEAPQITPSALTRAYAPDLTEPIMYWGISQICSVASKVLSWIPVVGEFLSFACTVAGCVFFGIAAWSLYNKLEEAKAAERKVKEFREMLQDGLTTVSDKAHEFVEQFGTWAREVMHLLTDKLDSWMQTPPTQQAATIFDFREGFVTQIEGSRDQASENTNKVASETDAIAQSFYEHAHDAARSIDLTLMKPNKT